MSDRCGRGPVASDEVPDVLRHRHGVDVATRLDFLREFSRDVRPGDLGENLTTADLELERMPLGTRIRLGPTAIVELTGLRTPCVLIERFRAGLKRHVLSSEKTGPPFRCGVLGVVRAGGRVAVGDLARVLLPEEPWPVLPRL